MNIIQHIAFNCMDLRRQEDFYARHFGYRRARVFAKGTPNEFVMLRLGSTCLELFQASAPEAGPSEGEQPVGFKHLAFEVVDLDATVAKFHEEGLPTGPIVERAGNIEGLRICFGKDPEGNIIELMEGWLDDETLAR